VPIPPRLEEIPTQKAIAKALGRLSTNALMTWWILEKGRLLMGLDCVRAHLDPSAAEEKDYARALRKYLDSAVERVESPQHRVILEIVLGLGEEQWKAKDWRKQKAKVRRTEAGRKFRPDEGTVTFGTIRQHHEPRALKALAEIVLKDEQQARDEAPE
jgi:transposase-like protein